MNINQIKELAQIVRENGLSALEVSENESCIRIEYSQRAPSEPASKIAEPSVSQTVQPEQASVDFNRAQEIKSPMVGVFYAAPAPDARPFAEVGTQVKKGDVVCIIEAMKLMNEIVAEFDGRIVDVCVHNGDVVEYGQTLFKLC